MKLLNSSAIQDCTAFQYFPVFIFGIHHTNETFKWKIFFTILEVCIRKKQGRIIY